MYKKDNQKFDIHAQHIIGDVQYPQGWFADAEQRELHGITFVDDPVRPTVDNRIADVVANADDTFTVIEKPLESVKAAKQAELKLACQAAIIAGIQSDALGSMHSYQTGFIDQQNITGLVVESLLPQSANSFKSWCADGNGVWARRAHSKPQIQAIGLAVSAHVKEQQEKYEQKINEVAAATSSAQVVAITW